MTPNPSTDQAAKLDADTANVQSAQSALQAAQANLESINNTSADSYLAQFKAQPGRLR